MGFIHRTVSMMMQLVFTPLEWLGYQVVSTVPFVFGIGSSLLGMNATFVAFIASKSQSLKEGYYQSGPLSRALHVFIGLTLLIAALFVSSAAVMLIPQLLAFFATSSLITMHILCAVFTSVVRLSFVALAANVVWGSLSSVADFSYEAMKSSCLAFSSFLEVEHPEMPSPSSQESTRTAKP